MRPNPLSLRSQALSCFAAADFALFGFAAHGSYRYVLATGGVPETRRFVLADVLAGLRSRGSRRIPTTRALEVGRACSWGMPALACGKC